MKNSMVTETLPDSPTTTRGLMARTVPGQMQKAKLSFKFQVHEFVQYINKDGKIIIVTVNFWKRFI